MVRCVHTRGACRFDRRFAGWSAGRYLFTTAEDPTKPGGDIDLYISVDKKPSLTSWDYRPYKNGSAEQATVTLSKPGVVQIMIYGYKGGSFVLTGKPAS